MSPMKTDKESRYMYLGSSQISTIFRKITLIETIINFKFNFRLYLHNIYYLIVLLFLSFLVFTSISGGHAALIANPIAPTSVNVCDSTGFVVYVNNTGTTFENNILLNVTIPIGFSYEDGTTIITFPKGSSNQDPQIKGAGAYLEWNLTDIMTAGTGVVINEILPNPIGTSDGANERVELCNAGNATVNVSGWYIHDAAGNKRDIESYKIYGSVLMEPGSFLVISIRYLDNGGD